MIKLLFLNLCILSFCKILFASDASFEDDVERPLPPLNHITEEAQILKNIQGEADTMDKNRAAWVFLGASYAGKLSVVKFLRERFDEGVLDNNDMYEALQWASVGGWLETVKYLMTGPKKAMIEQLGVNDALVNAAWKGHLPIVEYFMTPSDGKIIPEEGAVYEAYEAADNERHYQILKYLDAGGRNYIIEHLINEILIDEVEFNRPAFCIIL